MWRDSDKKEVDVTKVTEIKQTEEKLNTFLWYENVCGNFLKHILYCSLLTVQLAFHLK